MGALPTLEPNPLAVPVWIPGQAQPVYLPVASGGSLNQPNPIVPTDPPTNPPNLITPPNTPYVPITPGVPPTSDVNANNPYGGTGNLDQSVIVNVGTTQDQMASMANIAGASNANDINLPALAIIAGLAILGVVVVFMVRK